MRYPRAARRRRSSRALALACVVARARSSPTSFVARAAAPRTSARASATRRYGGRVLRTNDARALAIAHAPGRVRERGRDRSHACGGAAARAARRPRRRRRRRPRRPLWIWPAHSHIEAAAAYRARSGASSLELIGRRTAPPRRASARPGPAYRSSQSAPHDVRSHQPPCHLCSAVSRTGTCAHNPQRGHIVRRATASSARAMMGLRIERPRPIGEQYRPYLARAGHDSERHTARAALRRHCAKRPHCCTARRRLSRAAPRAQQNAGSAPSSCAATRRGAYRRSRARGPTGASRAYPRRVESTIGPCASRLAGAYHASASAQIVAARDFAERSPHSPRVPAQRIPPWRAKRSHVRPPSRRRLLAEALRVATFIERGEVAERARTPGASRIARSRVG